MKYECMQDHSISRQQNQKRTYPLCITILTAGLRLTTRDTPKINNALFASNYYTLKKAVPFDQISYSLFQYWIN